MHRALAPAAIGLLALLSLGPAPAGRNAPVEGSLALAVVDAEGAALPARVVVRGRDGKVVKSEYEQFPGLFTDEDGRLALPLPAGRFSLDVHRGIDFVSERRTIDVEPGRATRLRVPLQAWVGLRDRGWANGDAHAHLYTDERHDERMTRTVRRICRAQEVDFIFACQTWAGYGEHDWRAGYAKVSDERFSLFFGAEMPKYRTGHTFWLGLQSTRGTFAGAMDESFEDRYHLVAANPRWSFETVPFPNVPDVELVSRLREAEDAVAVIPHPTSWWWQPRDGVEKYVTNVAASLPVGLLAGGAWDGLVVMGYDHDHFFYQDLWFRVLDAGYRMTPFGELDGGYPPGGRFYYGSVRTYLQVGRELTRESIVRAARAGRSLVTSGPIVFASLEDGVTADQPERRHEPGDVVPADGRSRTLAVEAYASGDRDDRLSYLLLFRNGRVHRLWDLRKSVHRRFAARVPLREDEDAWYVLKAYGRTSRKPDELDVRAVVERLTDGTFAGGWPGDSDVALTSPFYFRRPGGPADPAPLVSHVRLRIVDARTGAAVRDSTVEVVVGGRTLARHEAPDGSVDLEVPVQAVLRLSAPGRATLHRVLYLDYPPLRERIERLASGRWLDGFGGRQRWQPGQVPWAAFDLAGTRRDLSQVDWTLRWEPNEREPLWEELDRRLEPQRATRCDEPGRGVC